MKVTADATVLLRLLVADDEAQALRVQKLFENAELVAVGTQALAEVVRVLRGTYGVAPEDIVAAIRALTSTDGVVANRAAVDAGLAALEAGGDFADGVVAYEGAWLGSENFVSFHEGTVSVLAEQGVPSLLL